MGVSGKISQNGGQLMKYISKVFLTLHQWKVYNAELYKISDETVANNLEKRIEFFKLDQRLIFSGDL